MENENNEQNDFINGIICAIKAFFSPKPVDTINRVSTHHSSLGYGLAGAYVLASTLASSMIASAPFRVANLFFFLDIELPYGELLYRGFTFGALTLMVFVACVHAYLCTIKRSIPLVKTINFVAAILLPATFFSTVAAFLSFLHLTTAIILIGFGLFSSLLLAIVGIRELSAYEMPLTWSAFLCFGTAIIIYFWLLGWTMVAPALTALFGA